MRANVHQQFRISYKTNNKNWRYGYIKVICAMILAFEAVKAPWEGQKGLWMSFHTPKFIYSYLCHSNYCLISEQHAQTKMLVFKMQYVSYLNRQYVWQEYKIVLCNILHTLSFMQKSKSSMHIEIYVMSLILFVR